MNSGFFTSKESKYIEKLFDEKQNQNNEVQFSDIKEIFNTLGFERLVTNEQIEKIRKKAKDILNIPNENDIFISKITSNRR